MPLINITIRHQLDHQSRDLIARQVAALLASQNAHLLQKVLTLMSALDDKITALQGETSGLTDSINAVAAAVTALRSGTEPTAEQLNALDAIGSTITTAKASLDAIVNPPAV